MLSSTAIATDGAFAGFNVETVEYKNISFTVWDVGGQDKARFFAFFSFVRCVGLGFDPSPLLT